ncbi:MAG TPA: hypothetical protein VKZ96_18380 [Thermomicrobiales bacterium]|nr:hypothetical protein [Thermomicrobiales bacterium]
MRVEWIILADSAEILNSKLYLMGGGWDRLVVNQDFPVRQIISIAVSFAVGWDETNIRMPMEIQIKDDQGNQLSRVQGHIEAGRPPGITPGQTQRVQAAFKFSLRFEREGVYTVSALINDKLEGQTHFSLVRGRGRAQRRARRPEQRKLDA